MKRSRGKVRRNPWLSVLTNPGRSGEVFGSDVIAVVYRHVDGGYYVHAFAEHGSNVEGADIQLDGDIEADGELRVTGLEPRTGVKLVANPDGSLTMRAKWHLWEER